MNQRIIYRQKSGKMAVIVPAPNCGLTVEQIAAKDVPAGLPYKIADASVIPSDRDEREAWTVDEADLTDGIGGPHSVFDQD